jgi:hypothetical protein
MLGTWKMTKTLKLAFILAAAIAVAGPTMGDEATVVQGVGGMSCETQLHGDWYGDERGTAQWIMGFLTAVEIQTGLTNLSPNTAATIALVWEQCKSNPSSTLAKATYTVTKRLADHQRTIEDATEK